MQGLMKIAKLDTYDQLHAKSMGMDVDAIQKSKNPGRMFKDLGRAHHRKNNDPVPGKFQKKNKPKKSFGGKAKGLLNKLRGKG